MVTTVAPTMPVLAASNIPTIEKGTVEYARGHAQVREQQGNARQCKRNGVAGQQEQADDQEQQQRQQLDHERNFSRARRNSATPCNRSRPASTGISVFSRKTMGRPLDSAEPSRLLQDKAT